MTNHPITPPPPELVAQIRSDALRKSSDVLDYELRMIHAAYRAGADQELEACCEWFSKFYRLETWMKKDLERFRAARRPKPPSLKEQAQAELDRLIALIPTEGALAMAEPIRRALQQLDD